MLLELLLELRGAGYGAGALTGREVQVLGMLRRGHTTAAIAERLHIAPVTVRRYISTLVQKLGVENRSALMDGSWPAYAAKPNARPQPSP
jgi:DNA-binding NarL/FixJ family response regulator